MQKYALINFKSLLLLLWNDYMFHLACECLNLWALVTCISDFIIIIIIVTARFEIAFNRSTRHFEPCRVFVWKKTRVHSTPLWRPGSEHLDIVVYLQFIKMNADSSLHSNSSDPEASSAAVPTYILYTYAFVEITKPAA